MLGTLAPEQIELLLQQECVGRIGCHADGITYVVPVNYWYDGEDVYCHSAEGQKMRMMRANPSVCFEVDNMRDMNHWECVVAQGRFEELGPKESEQVLLSFNRWLRPRQPSVTADPTLVVEPHDHTRPRTVAFRIRLAHKTGRFERRDQDAPNG